MVKNEDCDDLLKIYSDKNALPFFDSDNCDGDNFYYALAFWKLAYENGWFVRLSVVDKSISSVIGTIELCLRVSEDMQLKELKQFRKQDLPVQSIY